MSSIEPTAVRTRAARKSPQQRAAEIRAAAKELALDEGLGAVTLRGVAARVGVAPALVGHYVSSMDALVASTFTAIVMAELDEVAELCSGGRDCAARLGRLIAAALDPARNTVTVVWVEAWAAGRRNDELSVAVRTAMDAWQALVLGILHSGVRDGEFELPDPSAVAWQVMGMIDGLNAQALVHWGAADERVPLALRAADGMLGLPRGTLRA